MRLVYPVWPDIAKRQEKSMWKHFFGWCGIYIRRDIKPSRTGEMFHRCMCTVFESGVHPLDVNKENPTKLFVDSDFAGTGGRSTAGFVVFMNGGPVIWVSKLMKVAATSSSEAEIIAAAESVKTAVHFRALLEELGLCKVKYIDVYEDNLPCRMSAESLRCHKKARHYQAKLRYLQDVLQAGMIKFHQTKTADMIADLFTKPLCLLLSPD